MWEGDILIIWWSGHSLHLASVLFNSVQFSSSTEIAIKTHLFIYTLVPKTLQVRWIIGLQFSLYGRKVGFMLSDSRFPVGLLLVPVAFMPVICMMRNLGQKELGLSPFTVRQPIHKSCEGIGSSVDSLPRVCLNIREAMASF